MGIIQAFRRQVGDTGMCVCSLVVVSILSRRDLGG